MNLECKWDKFGGLCFLRDNFLVGQKCELECGKHFLGRVIERNGEPVIILNGSCAHNTVELTFTEIEHIMDNWYNMPKDV
jgi:hypothetical protein